MSKKNAIVFVALAAVFLIALVVLFVAVFGDYVNRKESISKSEVTNSIDYPLVDSATNVSYYWDVGGFQVSDFYMRVTVAAHDITNQVNLIIASDSSNSNRSLQYERKNIDSSEIIPSPDLHWWNKPIYWWTPEKITNGYYVGKIESYAYEIWVDESGGTLFIHQND